MKNARVVWFIKAKDKLTDHRIAEIVPEENFSFETKRWQIDSYDLIRDMLKNEDLKFDIFFCSVNSGKIRPYKLQPRRFIPTRAKMKTRIAVLKHQLAVQTASLRRFR